MLAADLSLPATLQRIVELGADLTAARYGALGCSAARGRCSSLWPLRERAEGLGGRAGIDSIPGQGTRVRVTIPR